MARNGLGKHDNVPTLPSRITVKKVNLVAVAFV